MTSQFRSPATTHGRLLPPPSSVNPSLSSPSFHPPQIEEIPIQQKTPQIRVFTPVAFPDFAGDGLLPPPSLATPPQRSQLCLVVSFKFTPTRSSLPPGSRRRWFAIGRRCCLLGRDAGAANQSPSPSSLRCRRYSASPPPLLREGVSLLLLMFVDGSGMASSSPIADVAARGKGGSSPAVAACCQSTIAAVQFVPPSPSNDAARRPSLFGSPRNNTEQPRYNSEQPRNEPEPLRFNPQDKFLIKARFFLKFSD